MRTLLLICIALGLCGPAAAHDRYSDWQKPGVGGSCCNMIDCREVPWRVSGGRVEIEIEGQWIEPPRSALLAKPSDDGTAHACWNPGRPPHCVQQPGGGS